MAADWGELRRWALALLAQEASLQEVVQLLDVEALAPEQRVLLRTGRLLREDFLQQSAFDDVDSSCPPAKQITMLRTIHQVHQALHQALAREVPARQLSELPVLAELGRMKTWTAAEAGPQSEQLVDRGGRVGAARPRIFDRDTRSSRSLLLS